jgi:hypothetical protein
LASVVLGNGHPFDSCPIAGVRVYRGNWCHEAEAYQAACLDKRISQKFKMSLDEALLTVVTKTLSGRANFGIVANVAALVASTTRE